MTKSFPGFLDNMMFEKKKPDLNHAQLLNISYRICLLQFLLKIFNLQASQFQTWSLYQNNYKSSCKQE